MGAGHECPVLTGIWISSRFPGKVKASQVEFHWRLKPPRNWEGVRTEILRLGLRTFGSGTEVPR